MVDGQGNGAEAQEERPADKLLLEGERFKAAIEGPQGNKVPIVNVVERNYDLQDDDEFFHLAYHVDVTLKAKIERGEFVDLERLLPRKNNFGEDQRCLEWVKKDRLMFLAPAQDSRDQKITNIRKWDQAFRVYAAIYCNANPGRTGEIYGSIFI